MDLDKLKTKQDKMYKLNDIALKVIEFYELFEVPESDKYEVKLDLFVGGTSGIQFIKKGERTNYYLGGAVGNSIINPKGERIGSIDIRIICDANGKKTNFRIGGGTGRRIFYVKQRET